MITWEAAAVPRGETRQGLQRDKKSRNDLAPACGGSDMRDSRPAGGKTPERKLLRNIRPARTGRDGRVTWRVAGEPLAFCLR